MKKIRIWMAACLMGLLLNLALVPAFSADVIPQDFRSVQSEQALKEPNQEGNPSLMATDTYAVEGGNLYFNSSTGSITDCDQTVTKADIPQEINGVSVRSIADWAFFQCSSLTDVTIPTGVTKIGNNTFGICSSLTGVKLPTGLTSIGFGAFSDCSSLGSVTIPNSVTSIGFEAFRGCSSLTSVTVPDKVTSLSNGVFEGCSSLTSMNIPESVTSIYVEAFKDCRSLKRVTLPSRLTSIAHRVFSGCNSLSSILIPSAVTSIGAEAFSHCSNLSSITIPSRVTGIGDGAFSYCTSLSSITIPSSVTSIGDLAFRNCSGLTNITVLGGVKNIAYATFQDCSHLTDVTLSSGITSIGTSAFQGCNSLVRVTIPSGVTWIGEQAFSGCSSLSRVNIPRGVTSISDGVFSNCGKLAHVMIPSGVTSIGNESFHACSSLSNVTIPSGVTWIGNQAFEYCSGLTSVTIPSSVTSINDWSFRGCTSLNRVYFAGNAPSCDGTTSYTPSFDRSIALYYLSGKSAWTTPRWKGYETVCIDALPARPEVMVQGNDSQYVIQVVDSKGAAVSGATVQWNQETRTTEESGQAVFPRATIGQPMITVSKDGYQTYSNANSNDQKSPSGWEQIVLYTTKESGHKLSQAYYQNAGWNHNILTGTKVLSLSNQGKDDDGTFHILCRAVNENEIQEYRLGQNGRLLAKSPDGNFQNLKLSDFTEGGAVSVRVVGTDGSTVETKLNLLIKKDVAVENWEVGFGDQVTFRVPDGIPFVGNSTLSMELPKLPFELIVEGEKIYGGLNLNWTNTDDDAQTRAKQWKTMKTDLERAMQYLNAPLSKDKRRLFHAHVRNSKQMEAALPKPVEIEVCGYVEGNLSQKELSGKLYVTLNLSQIDATFDTVVVVVPVTIQMKVNVEGKLEATAVLNWESKTLSGDVKLNVKPKLDAFGGVGLDKFVGVGAYGKAELDTQLQMIGTTNPPGLNYIDLTGELGMRAYLACFEYEKAWGYRTWHLYKRTEGPVTLASLAGEDTVQLFDSNEYQPMDLSYLKNESAWLGEHPIQLMGEEANIQFRTLLQDTYRNSKPLMAANGDQLLLAFARADASRSVENASYAAYSVYSNGSWSEPIALDPSGTFQSEPTWLSNGQDSYYLYQNTASILNAGVSLAEWAGKQIITAAKYDPQAKRFGTPVPVASHAENCYDHMASGTFVNGIPYIAWVRTPVTDDNSIWGTSTPNTIYYSCFEHGVWREPVAVATGLHAIVDLAVGEQNGALRVAYTIDGDNRLETTADRRIILGQTELVTGESGRLSFTKIPGVDQSCLVWNRTDQLSYWNGSSVQSIPVPGITGQYAILKDQILFSAATNGSANLFMQQYEDGTWYPAIQLTDDAGYFENMSAAVLGSDIYVAGLQTAVNITDTSVEDAKNLVWAKLEAVSDLAMDGVSYAEEDVTAGAMLPLTVAFWNKGDHAVTSVDVSVKKGDSILANETVALQAPVPSGALGQLGVKFQLPQSLTTETYTVEVTESGKSDFNRENSSTNIKLGYADLSTSCEVMQLGDTQKLRITLSNKGSVATDATVFVYPPNSQVALSSQNIEPLQPGDMQILSMDVTDELRAGQKEGSVRVSAISGTEELYTSNNEDQVYLFQDLVLTAAFVSSASEGAVFEISANASQPVKAICACYNQDGKMLDMDMQTVDVMNGKKNVEFHLGCQNAKTVKLFLTTEDGHFEPLIPSVEAAVAS